MKKEIIIMVILGILLIGIVFLGLQMHKEKSENFQEEEYDLPHLVPEKQIKELGTIYHSEEISCSS